MLGVENVSLYLSVQVNTSGAIDRRTPAGNATVKIQGRTACYLDQWRRSSQRANGKSTHIDLFVKLCEKHFFHPYSEIPISWAFLDVSRIDSEESIRENQRLARLVSNAPQPMTPFSCS